MKLVSSKSEVYSRVRNNCWRSINHGDDEYRLFYGKMIQRLEFAEDEPVRTQEEPFSYLLVDAAQEGRHLYDGLDMVFESSSVSIDGKEAQRRISLIDVPEILQIQLQRVQYNRAENKIFKSNAHMSFGDTISMDRYLEVAEGDMEGTMRRDRTNACRKEMEKARARLDAIYQDGVSGLFDRSVQMIRG
jgi:ubiquitin carboxyl-terminal hydrolase 25/28